MLSDYVDLTIEEGTGGGFNNCGAFTPATTLYSGVLSAYPTAHFDWASGDAVYTATGVAPNRTLRFTVEVQDVPAAQNQNATATFTWEAQDV